MPTTFRKTQAHLTKKCDNGEACRFSVLVEGATAYVQDNEDVCDYCLMFEAGLERDGKQGLTTTYQEHEVIAALRRLRLAGLKV